MWCVYLCRVLQVSMLSLSLHVMVLEVVIVILVAGVLLPLPPLTQAMETGRLTR